VTTKDRAHEVPVSVEIAGETAQPARVAVPGNAWRRPARVAAGWLDRNVSLG
jgi:hypothetical protein